MHIAWAMDWHSQTLLGGRPERDWRVDTELRVAEKSKEEMIAALDKTFTAAIKLMKEFDTNKLNDELDYFGLNRSKRQIFLLLADHISHHRGQMLVALRLNELQPPRYVLYRRLMSSKTAIKIMLGLLVAVILFHLSIVFKIVPYDITWGGRLTNDSDMYVFEGISIGINLLLIVLLLIKRKFLKPLIPIKVVNIILWIFLGLFALNTIGNLLAETDFEKWFAVLTLAFVVLLWVVLKGRESQR